MLHFCLYAEGGNNLIPVYLGNYSKYSMKFIMQDMVENILVKCSYIVHSHDLSIYH